MDHSEKTRLAVKEFLIWGANSSRNGEPITARSELRFATRGEGERFHDWAKELNFWVAVGQHPNYNILSVSLSRHNRPVRKSLPHPMTSQSIDLPPTGIKYAERIGRAPWIAPQFHQRAREITPAERAC